MMKKSNSICESSSGVNIPAFTTVLKPEEKLINFIKMKIKIAAWWGNVRIYIFFNIFKIEQLDYKQ